jgi:sulfopyruvate decarboxylase alpha subunit
MRSFPAICNRSRAGKLTRTAISLTHRATLEIEDMPVAKPVATDPTSAPSLDDAGSFSNWPENVYRALRSANVRHMAYVPDAGHAQLIRLLSGDPDVTCNILTSEQEGIAIAAGAWLGGHRSVLLLQSSGVGNCINMLSLSAISRFPLLMLVTMRGEWAEFNPWQVPMSSATEPSLNAMGVRTLRADTPVDLVEMVAAACSFAFEADQQIAILISQRMIGRKSW